jgi:hypothetical protein
MMKERPICFTTEMVMAILDSRKSMTRRVVKNIEQRCDGLKLMSHNDYAMVWNHGKNPNGGYLELAHIHCPYGEVGDLLWVKETWCPVDETEFDGEKWIDYRATPKCGPDSPAGWDKDLRDDPDHAVWKSSRFMPRIASRILLEITGIRVERVQDITIADCIAEGIFTADDVRLMTSDPEVYRKEFFLLWDKINGKKYPVEQNPWVWVILFKVLKIG